MIRQMRSVWVVLFVLSLTIIVTAQDDLEVYTFDSGVQFSVPADGVLDDSGAIPVITLPNVALIDVVDPALISETPGATIDLPLTSVLDFLLSAVGYEETRPVDETIELTMLDGREAMLFSFVNSSDAYQLVAVVRLSDGQIGAINVRSLEPLTQETVTTIGTLMNSLDIGTGSAVTLSDAEAELIADLTQEFAYDTGVNFRYPEEFGLVNEDNPPVTIGIDEVILISMVDPAIVGMPADEPMESVVEFAVSDDGVTVEDFEPFDIGGREAVIATAIDSRELYQTMVLVRFADGTVGIMDGLTLNEPNDELIDYFRRVAASFNSESAEVGITRADIDQARTLFEEAMTTRDAGNFEEALDLFTQAIDLNPDLALAFYWRAATSQRMGDFASAIEDYEQALALEPEQVQIREDIANMYVLLDDLDSAVAEMSDYIDEVGEDAVEPQILEMLAVYEAVADGEYDDDFYFSRANRYRESDLFDLALADNQVAIDNEPDEAELFAQRGVIYVEAEDYDNAISTFTDGLEIELLPILFYNRGFAHRENALNDFNSMVNGVHDFQCFLLLQETATQDEIDFAQRSIDMTLISSDDYEPITDPEACSP